MIRICINGQKILRKIDLTSTLNLLRESLSAIMTDNTILFVKNDQIVQIEEEKNIKCSSILSSGNELYLRKVFPEQQKNSIQVIIDQKNSQQVIINENQMISQLRIELASVLKSPFVFTQDEAELDISQEKEIEIKDMLQDNIIYVATRTECRAAEQPQSNKNRTEISFQTSGPSNLAGSKFINRKMENSLYLQPEFEENKTIYMSQQQKSNSQQNPSQTFNTKEIQYDDQSLFEEAKAMPPCSERCLQRLIFYTSLKLFGNDIYQQEDINYEIQINLEANIEEEFKQLTACLINEKNNSSKLDDSIKQCLINQKGQNWQKVYRILKNIFNEVKPLRIYVLKKLIGKVDEAAQLIKDQEIIMLLGGTGSGKSTLIHFMAGSEMQNVQVNGINHIQPSKVFNKMLDNVISSPFAESETRYITPVQVEFSSIRSNKRGSIMLVDSPGFEDTNGTEVDIANSIGIIKAVCNCQNVRPVILMSYLKLGDRMTGIKDLAHLLISMIPRMQEYFNNFTYIFTKFPKNEQSCINAKLQDTITKMSKDEKRDDNFDNLLANICEQTEEGAFVIDPINDRPGKTIDKIMNVKPIKRPSEVFQTFISQKSQAIINQQIQKHQLAIYQASKRGDYEIINYKLNELSFLIQELCQDSIRQIYLKCIEHASSNLIQNFQTATTNVDKCFAKNSNLTKEDILSFTQSIQGSQVAEALIQNHLIEQNVPHTEAYLLYIIEKVQGFVKEIQENDILNPLIVTIVGKIKLLSEYFEEIKSFYDQIIAFIMEKQNQAVVLYSLQLSEYNLKEASNNYYKFKETVAQYGQYFNQNATQNELENMNQALFTCLNVLTNNQQYVLSKDALTQEEIITLKNTTSLIDKATSCFNRKLNHNLDYIKVLNENFKKQIVNKFNQDSEKILLTLNKENQGNTSSIKHSIEQLESIHNIESIKILTLEKYIQTTESLKTFISEQKKEADTIISQIEQQYDQANYHKLSQFLDFLQNFQWINSYQEGIIEDNKSKIIEKIMLLTNNKITELRGISIDFENIQNFKNAVKLMKELDSILIVGKNIPQLVKLVNTSLERFQNDVQKVITKIQSYFGKYQQNSNQVLKQRQIYQSLMFLQECRIINYQKEAQCKQTLDQVRNFIEQYGEDQQQVWKRTLISLMQFKEDQTEEQNSILDLANKFYDCYKEVYQLSKKYYPVYQIYGKELDCEYVLQEKYQKDLMNLVENIREDMQHLYQQRQLKMLSIKLQVASNLKIMDEFLPPTQNFVNIYKAYQDKFYDNQSEHNLEMVKSIKEYNYNEVLNGFMKLEERKNDNRESLIKFKDILSKSLKLIIEETIILANRMRSKNDNKEEKVQRIVNNLKIIQDGERYLSDYMEPQDILTQAKNKIQEIIKKGMLEYVKYIDGLICNNNFYEAKEELTNIDLLCDILGVYCLQDVVDAIKKSNTDLEEQLKTLIEHYKQMKIEKYRLNPPKEIFEKLQKGIEDNYNTTLAQIQTDILQQLRNELVEVQNIVKNTTRDQRIAQLEAVLQHLPSKIKNIIEEEIKCTKDNIVNLQNERKNELKIVFESENIEEMKKRITQYHIEGDTDTIEYINDQIRSKIKQNTAYINNNYNSKIIDLDFTYHFVKLNECLKYIREFLPQQYTHSINASFDKINNQIDIYLGIIQSYFDNSQIIQEENDLNKTYFQSSPRMSFSNECEDIYQAIRGLMGFILFRQQYSDFADIFPRFDDICDLIIQKHIDTLAEIRNLYNESFKGDILIIVKFQQFYKESIKYEGVFKIWKDKSEILSQSKNTILANFSKSLNQEYKISDKINNFHLKILSLKQQFNNNCESMIDQNQHLIQSERDKFFKILNEQLQSLCETKSLDFKFLKYQELCDIPEQSIALLKDKIDKIIDSAIKKIENSDFNKEDCSKINVLYSKITSFNTNINKNLIDIEDLVNKINDQLAQKIKQIQEQIQQSDNANVIAQYLIQLQAISIDLSSLQNHCHASIQESIKPFQKTEGKVNLVKLGQVLDKYPLGQLLISEHKAFDGFCLYLFNQKINKKGIEDVLKDIKGDEIEIDQAKLRTRFLEYDKKYKELVKQYLVPNMDLKQPYLNLRILTPKTSISSNKNLQKEIYENIPEILAYLCALWTLENACYYFDAGKQNCQNNYLLQPHAAQIISIFRIVGSGDKIEQLQNNLVQVATGEGKSIILAMSAALLAICGFDVNCACYSSYLSKRDYQLFKKLFENLGLINQIHYGTFGEICEANINKNGDVRKIVENVINEKQYDIENTNKTERPKILLMDEVDVFFSKEFYGSYYSPISCIKHQTIMKLITLIWQKRSDSLTLDLIKGLPEYKALQQQFKRWDQLIDNQIINMIQNVKDYHTPEYTIMNDNIGYKEQDKIAFNVAYGYKTVFAYFDAHEKNLISKQSLENNIYISVNCGQFSFAEIPSQFQYILGVSGTLESLNSSEQDVIKNEYKIKKFSYIPSVFGKNIRTFDKGRDCMVENQDDYFIALQRDIQNKLQGTNHETQRAVLVFFENQEQLIEFYNSQVYDSLRDKTKYLTEEASDEEKQNVIKQSTFSGQITFFTKSYGRGTDIVSRDEIVKCNGGIHVIQAFLSEDQSEEVQIMGRTARQGEMGSFSMIILESSLDKILVTPQDIKQNKGKLYEFLNEKRNQYFNDQYNANKKEYVENSKKLHEQSYQFLQIIALNDKNNNFVNDFLLSQNKCFKVETLSKTLVLMDGTGSMNGLITKAKTTVTTMFEQACDILNVNGYSEGCFELQFAIFRSYNLDVQDLLQASGWEKNPENLRKFTSLVSTKGGQGREAVEIGLQYASSLKGVTQVILIGDAPPTIPEDVIQKRKQKGEEYWMTTDFKEKTDYIQESNVLKNQNVMVHAFFVHEQARIEFEKIAEITGGSSAFLDVNSPNGADILTQTVTKTILSSIGKVKGQGDALALEYIKKYGKCFK